MKSKKMTAGEMRQVDKMDQILALGDALIERAEKALEEAKTDFSDILDDDLAALEAAVASADREKVTQLAYQIKGRAGTVGWPLISAAANALAKLMERCPNMALDDESVTVHTDTLNLLFRDGMEGEDPRGQPLVRELYKIVEKESADDEPVV